MAKSKSLYQKNQTITFNSGKEVTIVKPVSSVMVKKAGVVMEISIYIVLYDNEEFYATDIGLNSRSDEIFKRVIAGIGYRGAIFIGDFRKEYDLWKNIIYRCYWANSNLYNYYGARGVTIDPKWLCFECFVYDIVEFANYNKFRSSHNVYDFDLEYKQGKKDISERVYGPGLVSLRKFYCTDVSRTLDEMKHAGTAQPVTIDESTKVSSKPNAKKKKTIEDFKPNPDGTWPDEAYQAVIDNPPKLKVPDADADLPIGAVRSLNGLIYTNRPPIIPIFKQSCRGMSLEEINNLIAENKNKSQSNENAACNTGIEMCKIVKK